MSRTLSGSPTLSLRFSRSESKWVTRPVVRHRTRDSMPLPMAAATTVLLACSPTRPRSSRRLSSTAGTTNSARTRLPSARRGRRRTRRKLLWQRPRWCEETVTHLAALSSRLPRAAASASLCLPATNRNRRPSLIGGVLTVPLLCTVHMTVTAAITFGRATSLSTVQT
jgi:hypothetical protein